MFSNNPRIERWRDKAISLWKLLVWFVGRGYRIVHSWQIYDKFALLLNLLIQFFERFRISVQNADLYNKFILLSKRFNSFIERLPIVVKKSHIYNTFAAWVGQYSWFFKRVEIIAQNIYAYDKFAQFLVWIKQSIEHVQIILGIKNEHDKFALFLRWFAWSIVSVMFVYLLNCYLSYWQNWPSSLPLLQEGKIGLLTLIQTALYPLAICWAALFAIRTSKKRTLRSDSETFNSISTFIIRAAFWAVLLVGLVDTIISFLRVEGLLPYVVGTDLAKALGRPHFRGAYVHLPLCATGIFIAMRRAKIDFIWLALLVVSAELAIVITRFVFSYEQAFMSDLVRFWYAALFLFASAYTLYTDAHVRVDVFYANFSQPTRSAVNAIGAILLGLLFCWTILLMGMWSKSSILITPLLGFEVSQSGFGMYIKYLMASFLSIFAVTMMFQFTSSLLENAANYRGDPGAREIEPNIAS